MGDIKASGSDNDIVSDMVTDIMDHDHSKEEILELKQMMEGILESIDEEILLLSPGFKVLWANKSFLNKTKYHMKDVLGKECYKLTHHIDKPCEAPNDECPVKGVIEKGYGKTVLHTHFDQSGNKQFVEVSAYPIKNKEGEIVQFIHLGRDISNKRRIEKERDLAYKRLETAYKRLRDVDQLKTDIISNVSHELRTPITISQTSIELAKEEELVEERERLLSMAEKALIRLNGIVDNLVKASEISEGKHHLKLQKFDLETVIIDLVKSIKNKVTIQTVDFDLSFTDRFPIIEGDILDLKSVFLNILENSLKFSKNNTCKIDINGRADDGNIEVCIKDNGIGIPEDKVNLIFSPLYQVDPSTTREFEGTGMGLAVAKSIIEAHGGQIWAKSKFGEGTSVYVSLPLNRN